MTITQNIAEALRAERDEWKRKFLEADLARINSQVENKRLREGGAPYPTRRSGTPAANKHESRDGSTPSALGADAPLVVRLRAEQKVLATALEVLFNECGGNLRTVWTAAERAAYDALRDTGWLP